MNVHKNARLTPHGRERLVRQVVSGQTPEAAGEPQASARERCANGLRDSLRGSGRITRSLLAAASAASADAAGGGRRGRVSAPPALHRQADRRRAGHLAGDRQPHPAGAWGSIASQRSSLPSRSAATSVRHPGELIHIDIKKLGRFERVGHRITGDRRGQSNSRRRRVGVRPRLHRRCLPRRLLADPAQRERKESAVAFLKAAVAYYAKPWRHRSRGS